MKKIFALLLAALMLLSCAALTACGKKEEESSSPSETETSSESASESESSPEAYTPDYSKYLTDEGFIEGIKALDVITIPDFSALKFTESELRAEEDVITKHIDSFLDTIPVENRDPSYTIKDGDTLNIDYVGSVDGVPFEGGDTKGKGTDVTIGVTSYIDDFLQQLIGHHPGENFDIEVTFPDPYTSNQDLSGKDAVFNITINCVKTRPELTDELLKTHEEDVIAFFSKDGLTTVDQLKQYISDHLFERALEDAIIDRMTEEGLPDAKEIPETAMDFAKNMTAITVYNYYRMTLEEFLAQSGYSEEEIEKTISGDAKMYMLVQAIAEQEGYKVTEEDLRGLTGADDYEGMIDYYGIGYVARFCLEEKAYEYMKAHITLE